MELTKIKDETCPLCNGLAIVDKKENQHTNGLWNETRIFSCGYHLKFSPNYMTVSVVSSCPNDPDNIAAKKQVDALKRKLSKVVLDSAVNGTTKRFILDDIDNMRLRMYS